MNCEETQTRLSEYLEKSLDTISMKGLEVHLSSCSRCRVEADRLAECIQQVASLPAVDLPLGFSQRVMAHVRAFDRKPALWERLFLPLRVKIPLQATAVALIGALAIVLSPNEEQFNRPGSSEQSAATIASPMQLEKKNEPSAGVDGTKKPIRSTSEPIARLAKQSAQEVRSDKASTSPASRPEPNATAQFAGESRLEDKKEIPRRPPIQAQEVATGREALGRSSDALGSGAAVGALRQRLFRSGTLVAERSLSPLSEPLADVEFVVRRRPRQSADQKDPGSIDTSSQATVAGGATPASPTISTIEIRWFTVSIDRFEQFKKELAAEASIESERAPVVTESEFAQKAGRELLIKVHILSPSEHR